MTNEWVRRNEEETRMLIAERLTELARRNAATVPEPTAKMEADEIAEGVEGGVLQIRIISPQDAYAIQQIKVDLEDSRRRGRSVLRRCSRSW